ncbi:MAG: MIP/aquaporin family protein [Rhodospirillaceae bacterium]|nr:MIP/aquaporin family protein [Rhodospirillaceae bacterium]
MTLQPASPRALLAETLGTALLLAGVVGSGIMGERLAQGNDAVALLANAVATGALLVVLIWMLGPVSGAHFNPLVSAVMARLGRMTWRTCALFIACQVIGAMLGVMLAHAMFDLPLLQTGIKVRTGASQWLAEAVAAFGLLLTILGVARHRPEAVAASVGLYITAAYWFTASTSFANPAVTLARAFTTSFAGLRPEDVLGFAAAQIIGAALAVPIARALGFLDKPE